MSDLTLPPSYVLIEEPEFHIARSQFENMATQVRSISQTSSTKWRLRYENQTQSEFETFIAFFKSKKGPAISFTWTNPNDDTEYTVRFVDTRLPMARQKGVLYEWDCELELVI